MFRIWLMDHIFEMYNKNEVNLDYSIAFAFPGFVRNNKKILWKSKFDFFHLKTFILWWIFGTTLSHNGRKKYLWHHAEIKLSSSQWNFFSLCIYCNRLKFMEFRPIKMCKSLRCLKVISDSSLCVAMILISAIFTSPRDVFLFVYTYKMLYVCKNWTQIGGSVSDF